MGKTDKRFNIYGIRILQLIFILFFITGITVGVMDKKTVPDLVKESDLVVTGTVKDIESNWDDEKLNIYTITTIIVNEVFLGPAIPKEEIKILSKGGTVNEITQWVEDEPSFSIGSDVGLLLNYPLKNQYLTNNMSDEICTVTGNFQGVFSIQNNKVDSEEHNEYGRYSIDEFKLIIEEAIQGREHIISSKKLFVKSGYEEKKKLETSSPMIQSVTPSTASAGTDTIITIKGTGFGTKSSRDSNADVFFLYRFNGQDQTLIWASGFPHFSINEYDIVSWTDSQIRVKVPVGRTQDNYDGGASSGYVGILTDNGEVSNVADFSVTFSYGKRKWPVTSVNYYINPGSIIGSLTAIQNAANSWNGQSSFKFNYAGTSSTTKSGADGKNVLLFRDLGSSGPIAQATYWFSSGIISEADVEFNTYYSWTTDTASGGLKNIEAIAIHELGHWLNLKDLYGWVPGFPSDLSPIMKVMFGYNGDVIGNTNLKTLSASEIAGIKWIYGGSGPTPTPTPTLTPTPTPTPTLTPTPTPTPTLTPTPTPTPTLTPTPTPTPTLTPTPTPTPTLTPTPTPTPTLTPTPTPTPTLTPTPTPTPTLTPTPTPTPTLTPTPTPTPTLTPTPTPTPTLTPTPTPIPVPVVTGIIPESGQAGLTINYTVTGSNFVDGAFVHLVKEGQTNITSTGTLKEGKLTGIFNLPLDAITGPWNVIVEQDELFSNDNILFTITPAPADTPVITSINPDSGEKGTEIIYSITGEHLLNGAIVNLTHEGEENITSIGYLMGSQLFGTFVIPTDALTGPWNASVNQNGLYSNDEIQFTITDGPVHIPVVHNITPDSGMQGESTDYLLQGENLTDGALVNLSHPEQVNISSTGNLSEGNLTGTIAIPDDALPGPWNVTVNQSGLTSNDNVQFIVLPSGPFPVVRSIAMSFAAPGKGSGFVVYGENFENGAIVNLSHSGEKNITAIGELVKGTLTGTFSIPESCRPGLWNVTVNVRGKVSNDNVQYPIKGKLR
ncbi:hypothetical protein Mhun_0432 [Methanospirillum hungatei JF-1]|uniref:Peptidase metallopeptidase domain-containing protein n=2 Tax=Methanospirillum hungatei TaxID=2203 RepID=Q2FQH1_METHJ|nr:hypothetical protein Mhun_0432 [Methanospirillum hungatei JF-1]